MSIISKGFTFNLINLCVTLSGMIYLTFSCPAYFGQRENSDHCVLSGFYHLYLSFVISIV
jgi:hypothetical protein